jgi:poly(A) polymerase Pap1
MCVEKLRAMHWWAQLRGLRGVVFGAVGGGVYALVALGSSPVGSE